MPSGNTPWYKSQFGESFARWLSSHPQLYRLHELIDVVERAAPISHLLDTQQRLLVADDYIGLDVLSSQMDVKTSNFRRVPALPIYGCAQPSSQGIASVVAYVHKKQCHPRVIWVNLRDDVTVQCDLLTYSVRDTAGLDEPILLPGATRQDIEEREECLKNTLKTGTWKVYREVDMPGETRQFTSVETPMDMFHTAAAECHVLEYTRLPISDDAAPLETMFDELLSLIINQRHLYSDEDGPAFIFQCRTGKGRTTTAMAIAGLIICHLRGFPYGTKAGEEERVSLPNAKYTQGNYKVVQELVRRIPDGHQVKREVDFVLNQISDTMTPMHYHIREVIFVTYNKMKKATTMEDEENLKKRCVDLLERYIYLILFNTYLHCDRRNKWQHSFSSWMSEVAVNAGVYEILDNLEFSEFNSTPSELKSRRVRWTIRRTTALPARGQFI